MAYVVAKEKYGCRICGREDVPHHFVLTSKPRARGEVVVSVPWWRRLLDKLR